MKPEKFIVIPISKIGISYLWMMLVMVYPALIFITVVFIGGSVSAREVHYGILILYSFFWSFFIWFPIFWVKVFCGKVFICENGIVLKNPFMCQIEYSWEKVQSCGIDFRYIDTFTRIIYFSKFICEPLDYHPHSYKKHRNVYWNRFLRSHHALYPISKRYQCLLMIDVTKQNLEDIKKFLPEHLLSQLEESERRLAATYPNLKK